MKYLVTGSAGFIGFHLIKALLKDNKAKIWGVDNINNYYSVDVKYKRNQELKNFKNYKFFKLDITDEKMYRIFKKIRPNVVINLAAQAGVRYSIENPNSYIKSNLIGFYNILNLSKGFKVKHFFMLLVARYMEIKKNYLSELMLILTILYLCMLQQRNQMKL